MTRLIRGIAAALVAAGALVVLTGAPASAHASLLSTDPADGSVVATAPTQVVLTFNEHIRVDSVQAFTADGSRWPTTARAEDDRLVVTPTADPGTGTVLVAWKVVSADGHVVGGSLSFSIGTTGTTAGAAGSARSAGAAGPPTATALARWVALAVAVAGLAATLALGGLRRPRGRDLAWDVGLVGAVALAPLHGLADAGRGLGGLADWVAWLDGLTEPSTLAVLAAYAVVAVLRSSTRRAVAVAATGLVVVLVGTAALTWPAAADRPAPAAVTPPAGPQTVRTDLAGSGTAELTTTPDGPRTVRLDLRLVDPTGAPLTPYAAPTITVSTPDLDLGDVALTAAGPGTYRAEVTVPTPGTWRASVSVRTTEFDNPVAVLAFTVE